MAITDPYITVPELRDYCDIPDNINDVDLARVVSAISRSINLTSGRQFNDAVTPLARTYFPTDRYCVNVDDFHTTVGLVVKTGDGVGGVYSTTISSAEYTALPLNGIVNGQTGWPFNELQLHNAGFDLPTNRRATVQVTARWGWSAVPDDVKTAALILGAQKFGRKSSRNGMVSVGQGDFVFRVSRIADPDVRALLSPYWLPVAA